MRRISSVLVDATAYVSLAYILLRIPFALVYAGILAFAFCASTASGGGAAL